MGFFDNLGEEKKEMKYKKKAVPKAPTGPTNYATFNILKVSNMSSLAARGKHNSREQNLDSLPSSIDTSLIHLNTNGGGNAHLDISNRIKEINEIRKRAGARAMRKTTVPAVELVLSASVDFFKDPDEGKVELWVEKNIEWAEEHYKDNGKLMRWDFHQDETGAPHLHLIFIPEVNKVDKTTGKLLPVLSAKAFQGSKAKMNADRTSHAVAMEDFELVRGTNNYEKLKAYEVELEAYNAEYEVFKAKYAKQLQAAEDQGISVKAFLDDDVKEPVPPVKPEKKKYTKKTKNMTKRQQEYKELADMLAEADNELKEEMWKRPGVRSKMVKLEIFPASYKGKRKKKKQGQNQ